MMQDFFQTFWDILVQNRPRLIFIFLSSLVLHVLFKRFIEATTKFLFVVIRSLFFKDIKLFYDYRWQKTRYISDAELNKHYTKHLELIHNHDLNNGTNYFDKTIANSIVKKALHILLDIFYLKDSKNYALVRPNYKKSSFEFNEMSYATFIYRFYFKHYGLTYIEIKGVNKLEQSLQNFLVKTQLFILKEKINITFFIDFCGIYVKWLWIVLKLNWEVFTIYFDNSVHREIDKKLEELFESKVRMRSKTFAQADLTLRMNLNIDGFPASLLEGEEDEVEKKWHSFRKSVETLEENHSCLMVLTEYDSRGIKSIDYDKFKNQNFIRSFQTDNYDDSKNVNLGLFNRKMFKEEINHLKKKGKDVFFTRNSLINRKNLNAFWKENDVVVRWYYNFKTLETEFKLKYVLINKENLTFFKDFVYFIKEAEDSYHTRRKKEAQEQNRAYRRAYIYEKYKRLLNGIIRDDDEFVDYKRYYNALGNASLIRYTIMKKSWFFNSSNKIFDTYLNSVGFLLFFIIAFVLEEIYSEPVISFIEKITTFFSSLF
jgi:hypothetical protein